MTDKKREELSEKVLDLISLLTKIAQLLVG